MRLWPSRLFLEAFGEPRQAGFCQGHVSFPQSFLRPVNPRSAFRAKQGILHVHSRDNPQTLCLAGRKNDGLQRRQIRPSNNPFPIFPPKPPTERASHPKTAIVGRAPAKADQKSRHNLPIQNLRNQDSQAICIQVKRMKLVRGQRRQPHDLRRFDDCRARSGNPPPRRPNGLPGGVDRFDASSPTFFLESDGFPKTIPAIAHGNQLQTVSRPNAAPTPRNRSGRFHCGQRPFELVGNNNDSRRHGAKLAKGRAIIPAPSFQTKEKSLPASKRFVSPIVKNHKKTAQSDPFRQNRTRNFSLFSVDQSARRASAKLKI